jgi:hypothetical protein
MANAMSAIEGKAESVQTCGVTQGPLRTLRAQTHLDIMNTRWSADEGDECKESFRAI